MPNASRQYTQDQFSRRYRDWDRQANAVSVHTRPGAWSMFSASLCCGGRPTLTENMYLSDEREHTQLALLRDHC